MGFLFEYVRLLLKININKESIEMKLDEVDKQSNQDDQPPFWALYHSC